MTFYGMYSVKIKSGSLLLPWKMPQKTLYGYIVNDSDGKPYVIIATRKPTDNEADRADVTYSFTFRHHHGRWNNIPSEVTFALGEEVYIIGGCDRMELYRKSDIDDERRRIDNEAMEDELRRLLDEVIQRIHESPKYIYKAKNGKYYMV